MEPVAGLAVGDAPQQAAEVPRVRGHRLFGVGIGEAADQVGSPRTVAMLRP